MKKNQNDPMGITKAVMDRRQGMDEQNSERNNRSGLERIKAERKEKVPPHIWKDAWGVLSFSLVLHPLLLMGLSPYILMISVAFSDYKFGIAVADIALVISMSMAI